MELHDSQYEEIGRNYRFYLTWRHGIFAGQLIVLWVVLRTLFNLCEKGTNPTVVGLFLFGASILSLILWVSDFRVRFLYRKLDFNGSQLERNKLFAFSTLNGLREERLQRWNPISHSFSQNMLGWFCFSVYFSLGIISLNTDNLLKDFPFNLSPGSWWMLIIGVLGIFCLIDPFTLKYFINKRDKDKRKLMQSEE